jgi:hypothetical protein
MFALTDVIPNDGVHSMINEVSFSPDGESFAAAYEYSDEVRIYDARTLTLRRTFRNPAGCLNRPHGILLTSRHLIVANKGDLPCTLCVFRLDDEGGEPTQYTTTPFAHLAEGHSIALRDRRMVVSYCEGQGKEGALVCYDFDDTSGRIGEVLDKTEHWFSSHGDAKGVSFDATGERLYVTFQSDWMPWPRVVLRRLKNAVSGGTRGGPSRNGLAIFGIDAAGRFTPVPTWKRVERGFCRLENIHVLDGNAAVTDPAAGTVMIYDLQLDARLTKPVQVIRGDLAFPHGAKLSPDGTLLLVSDNGITTIGHTPQWRSFTSPRKDRLMIYRRQPAGVCADELPPPAT